MRNAGVDVRGVGPGRGGAVVVIRRFGGALNLNVHFHALVLDGVFAGETERLAFHPIGRLTALDAEEVLATVQPLVESGGFQRAANPTTTA